VIMVRSDSFRDGFIAPGTAVRYDGLGEAGPEFGIVVHCWQDTEINAHDCYVAFLGADVPTGKPREKPYVLRYAARSLARLDRLPGSVGGPLAELQRTASDRLEVWHDGSAICIIAVGSQGDPLDLGEHEVEDLIEKLQTALAQDRP
jgi:hypothetical protein